MNKKAFAALITSMTIPNGVLATEAPDYRLPPGIQPTKQTIELTVDPASPEYSGHVVIHLSVDTDVERIGIHQLDLEMTAITLSSGKTSRDLQATVGEYAINWLADGDPIPAGEYELSISFNGTHSTDSLGMHRVTFEDNDYIFTHFESMHARRAFPLFDEPSFKIDYQLTVLTQEAHTVVSNTPVATSSLEDSGWQRVEFMPTRPMPGYLIALAVGPLDRAPLEGMSVPGAIYTPKGHADKVGFVQRETPTILKALEDYFGLPYPYRKMDFLAVPEFAIGGMENPGLITYRTDLLMLGDEAQGATAERTLSVVTHEISHMWFGDYVSIKWWSDMWLKEAFATWIQIPILVALYPQYESALKLPQIGAFASDRQTTSTAVRRTVRNEQELNADLRLNYNKGSSMLYMLEDYVGKKDWRQGVRAYIKKHAWGSAEETDLWDAISEASGLDVRAIAATYLNQPGFAILNVSPSGEVSQQRYLTYDLEAEDLEWAVPISIKYKDDGHVRQTSYLLEERSGRIDIPEDAEWIFPDAGANGYYRWQVDEQQFSALVADVDELTNREKVALLDNSEALLNAGRLSLGKYLGVVSQLLTDSHPLVFLEALERLKVIADDFMDPSSAALFARLVDDKLAGRYAAIGAEKRPGDSEALIQLRPRLVRMLGQYGSDASVITAAAGIANRYLAAPETIGGDLGKEALRVTALSDDGGRYEQFIEAYLASDAEDQKTNILHSIYFRNSDVVKKHLDFCVSDAVPAGDSWSGLRFYTTLLPDHADLYAWLDANVETLEAKIPADYHALLPRIMVGVCNETNLAHMRQFFADRGDKYAVSLGKAVESVETCISRKQRESDALMEYLAQYKD